MENEFEDFIERHGDQFGASSPSPEVWQRMEKRLVEYHKAKRRKARVRQIGWLSAAAAACFLAALLFVLYTHDGSHPQKVFVARTQDSPRKQEDAGIVLPVKYARAIDHYRITIEQKQRQLDSLRKSDPDLYESFKKASEAMTSLYKRLQAKLPTSPDRDKVLSLMIKNLQIQEDALNNQLELLMGLRSTETTNQKPRTDDL